MSDLRAAVDGLRNDAHELYGEQILDRVLALIPKGAVLVTEADIEDALHWYEREGWLDGDRSDEYRALAILRHLREET